MLSDSFETNFEHEVQLLSNLRHPNILKFYGACLLQPRIGYVMEYCEKGSLDQLLANEKLSMSTKLSILRDIARGMEFLHSKNILHRDLKPANVMIDKNYIAKVADFDKAKMNDMNNKQMHTMRVGTAYYAAPEVVLGLNYDEKCDVFSFGMLMYEVLHGYLLSNTDFHSMGVSWKIARDPSYRPKVNIDLEPWINELLSKCWSHDTKERPLFNDIVQEIDAHTSTQEKVD
jgi:serine/threonine protein kinase